MRQYMSVAVVRESMRERSIAGFITRPIVTAIRPSAPMTANRMGKASCL